MPVLIVHLHDYRLTRSIKSTRDRRYTWHVRVADVVADLLDELAAKPFSYDFRAAEGRGKSLDRNHVLHWWTQTQQTSALEYLRKNALTQAGNGKLAEHEHLLRLLADRYPDELVRLFEQQVKNVEQPYYLFQTLADSRVAKAVKVRLFRDTAKSKEAYTRRRAVDHLLRMEHSQAVPLVIKELDGIPRTPKESYWWSSAGSVARLVCLTNDERAWAYLVKTARRVDIGQRLQILEAISNDSGRNDSKAIVSLAFFLDDAEVRVIKAFEEGAREFEKSANNSSALDSDWNDPYRGFPAGHEFPRLGVRDFAAMRLANLLELDSEPKSSWKDEDWAKFRTRVRQALDKKRPDGNRETSR